MLKITTRTDPTATIFELEGKLAGPWVQELEASWREATDSDRAVRVMLCAVTFIDDKGRDLLVEIYRRHRPANTLRRQDNRRCFGEFGKSTWLTNILISWASILAVNERERGK
jgi:hypothetical protein